MAGTIVTDRIESDATYQSKIELASPVLVTNEFSVRASGNTGVFNIVGANTSATRTVTLPDEAGTVLTNVSSLSAPNLTGNVAVARITTALNATGDAPIYACRAWVNFNGIGTVAIRASGNVSSITDNGTGDYTVNFTTAMVDANYVVCTNPGVLSGFAVASYESTSTARTTSAVRLFFHHGGSGNDSLQASVAIFR